MAPRPPAKTPAKQPKTTPAKAKASPQRDLLTRWVEAAGLGPEVLTGLVSWLAKDLVADQHAKLEQGSHTQGGVPLRKVFIDLPISTNPVAMVAEQKEEERALFVATLLALPAQPLACHAGEAIAGEAIAGEAIAGDEEDLPRRGQRRDRPRKSQGLVLVGGPGQGKSTVTQLACQLYRAALLTPFLGKEGHLSPSQATVLQSFIAAETKKDLAWPKQPLLPIRIVLPEAAAWLAQQEDPRSDPPALLQFLAGPLAGRVSEEALAALLREAPLLLALDGLDEVGATEDRTRLLGALRGLLQWLGQAKASGVVVATTRPQGYTGELERLGLALETRYLALLRADEALRYGRRLADAKLVDQPEVHQRVVKGLEAAAKEPATARLMATPLQVTILAVLVQRLGQRVPKERWGLFERYFETIFDREIERNTYASPLLSDHRTHIRELHARVGLLLQVEFEQSGAEARLSKSRLEQLAEQILREDGIDEVERAELVQSIARAAKERLVFLVEPEPERFGFEIRSLQEYMAAFALATGEDELALQRLRQIAKAPTFRAVTLFLASRAFTERSPLRDALAPRVCAAIDEEEGDDAARSLRVGALLALELLEEGSVLNQPKFAQQLLERACGLLALPPGAEHARLATVASRLHLREKDPLQATLEAAAKVGAKELPLSAWMTLVEAASHGIPWACALAERLWQGLTDAGPLLRAYERRTPAPWLLAQIEMTPAVVTPTDINGAPETGSGWLAAWSRIDRLGRRGWYSWTSLEQEARRADWQRLALLREVSHIWRCWALAADFALAPNRTTLAAALRGISGDLISSPSCYRLANSVPWPLAVCLRSAGTVEDLERYADQAEAGALGDVAVWQTAEVSWGTRAAVANRKLLLRSHRLPWDPATLSEGPPLGINRGSLELTSLPTLEELNKLPRASWVRRLLAEEVVLSSKTLSWAQAEQCMQEAGMVSSSFLKMGIGSAQRSQWLIGLARLAQARIRPRVVVVLGEAPHGEWLVANYTLNTDNGGLLYWLRLLISSDCRFLAHKKTWRPTILTARTELNRALAQSGDPDDPALQADAAVLRLWTGALLNTDASSCLPVIREQAQKEPALLRDLLDLLPTSALPNTAQESLLVAMLTWVDLPVQLRIDVTLSLRSLFSSRKSDLADTATWRRLKLPLPAPQAPAAHHTQQLPEHPVVLSRVELQRIRGVAALSLDLSPPIAEDQGQWVVFLGPNGAGKTTLLRALALALRDLENPKIWPKGTFATPWCSFGGGGRSLINVQVASGGRSEVVIQRNGSETFKQERRERPGPFPLFAYGCRRGSALGGAARELNTNEDDGPEVATLFDEGAALIHAETWLVSWDGAAAKTPRDAAIYSAVCAALRELLAIDSIEVSDRRVVVSGPGVGIKVPLAALSDGYLTTAGWFLDLIARWIELAQKHGSIGPDFLRRMTGLVLLDEIDLHLHPSWQLQVIPRVKQLLPRMSFVVTTHNPLTLVGARPEEIWVLSSSKGAIHAARGTEVPMLLTGGQILSRYFGIHDLYPHEIGEALRRYGLLSADPRRSDAEDAEMQTLMTRLRGHGIDPGWEPTPREQPRPGSSATKARRKKGAP